MTQFKSEITKVFNKNADASGMKKFSNKYFNINLGNKDQIKLKDSVATKLLRFIFFFYSVITFVVTISQLVHEHKRVEENILAEITSLQETFLPSLKEAYWGYNAENMYSLLLGMFNITSVVGIQLFDMDNNEIMFLGYAKDKAKNDAIKYRPPRNAKRTYKPGNHTRLFGTDFVIRMKDEDGVERILGTTYIFSSNAVVFERIKYGFFLIVINSLIKTAALWIIIFHFIRKYVGVPLRRLAELMDKIDPKDPNLNEFEQEMLVNKYLNNNSELGMLSKSFDRMGQSIILNLNSLKTANAEIHEMNENLEKIVKARTQEVRSILQNIKLGIVYFDEKLKFGSECSSYMYELFPKFNKDQDNIFKLLFDGSNLSIHDQELTKTAVQFSVGQDEFNYMVNEHNLVREISFTLEGDKKRYLEISWQPMYSDSKMAERIMVVLKDVTELKILAQKSLEQNRELEIIKETVNIGIAQMMEFLEENYNIGSKFIKTLSLPNATISLENVNDYFRYMHTLKGSARTYNLGTIKEVAHDIEQTFDHWRKDIKLANVEEAIKLFNLMQDSLVKYRKTIEDKLGSLAKKQTDSSYKDFVDQMDLLIKAKKLQDIMSDAKGNLEKILKMRNLIDYSPLENLIKDELTSLPSLAKQMEKLPPVVDIQGSNVLISKQHSNLVKNVMMHCLRNSMDHGIQHPKERENENLNPQGKITLKLEDTSSESKQPRIILSDDGKGLNIDILKKMAVKNGLIPADADDMLVAQSIFMAGVSTAEKVTDISGRGVGMDAVRSFLQQANGDIKIEFTGEKKQNGCRPFKFVISMPQDSTIAS